MPKKSPKPVAPIRSLSRKSAQNNPLPVVYVFSEGRVTEPEYINAFYRDLCRDRKIAALSPIIGGAGVPMTIIEKCVAKKAELRRLAKENSFEKNSSVLAVFDVDVHPRLDEALALAKKNKVHCIISNPCIEVWGLMHLHMYERPSTRYDVQAELAKSMPGYHHANSPIFPWDECRDKVDTAIGNSISAIDRRKQEGSDFPRGNPTTNFHELLNILRGPKKGKEPVDKKEESVNVVAELNSSIEVVKC